MNEENIISWRLSSFLSLSSPNSLNSFQHSNHYGLKQSKTKCYDYLLKFLLVGDSDVGKEEILNGLDSDATVLEPHFCGSPGVPYKITSFLLDGKRIRLHIWDASGQGRFSTILRSYSRGTQGVLLVYDITNKWSFSGLDRWLQEVEEHAPGVPKILIGNRLHLAFKRQVPEYGAMYYAQKHNMSFFEVSSLCNFNIQESFAELSRMVLKRNGMDNVWKHNTVISLQELCCRSIVTCTTVYGIDALPLPSSLKSYLKSYSSMTSYNVKSSRMYYHSFNHNHKLRKDFNSIKKKAKALFSCDNGSHLHLSNNNIHSHLNYSHRNRDNRDQKNCAIS